MNLSQEELNKIVKSHKKWLHDEEGGERADLRGADLMGADLHHADLKVAYLSGADLTGASLICAYLSGADLTGASLICAYLGDANLRNAELKRAYLRGADLRGADLTGASLTCANLSCARLDKTYYQIVRIGSRNDTTTYCVEDDNVTCGCWNDYKGGTLAEFKERVKSVYGKDGERPNEKYYGQYMDAIVFFERRRK